MIDMNILQETIQDPRSCCQLPASKIYYPPDTRHYSPDPSLSRERGSALDGQTGTQLTRRVSGYVAIITVTVTVLTSSYCSCSRVNFTTGASNKNIIISHASSVA